MYPLSPVGTITLWSFDNTFLDYNNAANPGYAVFGKVVQGMDIVDIIVAQPTGISNGFADVPLTDVVISLALQTQ